MHDRLLTTSNIIRDTIICKYDVQFKKKISFLKQRIGPARNTLKVKSEAVTKKFHVIAVVDQRSTNEAEEYFVPNFRVLVFV